MTEIIPNPAYWWALWARGWKPAHYWLSRFRHARRRGEKLARHYDRVGWPLEWIEPTRRPPLEDLRD